MSDILEVPDEMKAVFHNAYQNNPDNLQKGLWAVKNAGYYQILTIKLLMTEFNISLKEATTIFSTSDAWK